MEIFAVRFRASLGGIREYRSREIFKIISGYICSLTFIENYREISHVYGVKIEVYGAGQKSWKSLLSSSEIRRVASWNITKKKKKKKKKKRV